MSDTGSYSDLMFGLFWCLGYQFSPRLAELKEARFWRIDPSAEYGPLNGLARHRISINLIATNCDDILRVAGSLKVGTVHASTLVQSLQRGGHPTTLARAIAELGRIPKTLHLLNYLDDDYYRRRIQIQLNRGEGRHGVARHVFHGQLGELRQRYRQGQEDQLGALGLVISFGIRGICKMRLMYNVLWGKRFDQRMWNASLHCVFSISMFMANIISLSQRPLLRGVIVPCDNLPPRTKRFSKFSIKETEYIWATFLFQLSVPTMGKPQY